MALTHDQGIVLRSFPFGEADRLVVLLSPNNGKLRAVAKGVRRTRSRFGGRLEPFTNIDLVLYQGRSLFTITQASVIDAFPRLREDLDRVVSAATMVEVADAVSQENESSVRLFLLLHRGLKALEAGPAGPDVVTSYLIKAAGVVGVAPALDHCAGCGRREDIRSFSFDAGGVMCERCRTSSAHALRPGLTEHLAALAEADLSHLPGSDPEMAGDAMGVARRFLEHHLERRLVSLAFLDA